MKTTKKGFTLIELIVVIAIIGVLAAILVPSMLGYVRKSKISSANSTASSVYKAINSALTELDEEGIDVSGDYTLTIAGGSGALQLAAAADPITSKTSEFYSKVQQFFNDIDRVKGDVKGYITGGSCAAVGVASDNTYTGTYPTGVVTGDNYKSYSAKPGTACTAALSKIGINETIAD